MASKSSFLVGNKLNAVADVRLFLSHYLVRFITNIPKWYFSN